MTHQNYRKKAYNAHGNQCWFCHSDADAIHHINGDNDDNRLENLAPVCNNCHWKLHNTVPRKKLTEKLKEYRRRLPKEKRGGISEPPESVYVDVKVTNGTEKESLTSNIDVDVPENFGEWGKDAKVNYLCNVMDRGELANLVRELYRLDLREKPLFRKDELIEIATQATTNE